MATYNLNTTASVDLLSPDISASQETTFSIANPLSNSSYFTFETVRNSDGFYDSSSPKNMAGTYSLGAGLSGVVKSDYIASVIVRPGGGDLTFTPDNYISGSSLNLRGTSSPPAPTGTSFDADYQAVLNYATTQGYTLPSSGQQTLQNQLVVDLKDAGVWNKLDLFYVFAIDGDSDFASINWKDPNNFEITEVNSPTFTTNVGFTGDGSSAKLYTNFNPSTDRVNYDPKGGDGQRFVWATDTLSNGAIISDYAAGGGDTSDRFRLNNTGAAGNRIMTTSGVVGNLGGSGLWYTEFDGTNRNYYLNDTFVQAQSSTATTNAYRTDWQLLGDNVYYDGNVKFHGIGSLLSATEQTDLYNALDTYNSII